MGDADGRHHILAGSAAVKWVALSVPTAAATASLPSIALDLLCKGAASRAAGSDGVL